MGFRLRYRQHDLELHDGRFLIGRSASCQLSLDDPMVSRQHAALVVSGQTITVEDLGSRNGVQVNNRTIEGPHPVVLGDVVKIGSQEMTLVEGNTPKAREITHRGAATARLPSLAVLAGLAEKALTLRHADDAERVTSALLRDINERIQAGIDPGADVIAKTATLLVRLALLTANGSWIDSAVKLFSSLHRPLPVETIDELHDVLRRVGAIDMQLFRAYAEDLRARANEMGPADRFLVGRIEGLARMAALR
jgi:hypothetical protein